MCAAYAAHTARVLALARVTTRAYSSLAAAISLRSIRHRAAHYLRYAGASAFLFQKLKTEIDDII